MAELKLPELGENIETADVSAVLVSVGDRVQRDQPVIEVETEKASLEVPSTCDGRVEQLLVAKGDKISIGQVILIVDSGAMELDAAAPAAAAAETGTAAPAAEPAQTSAEAPEREPVEAAASVFEFPTRPKEAPPEIGEVVAAAPSVRALARELGVTIGDVRGSGAAGRITRDDVKKHAKGLIEGLGGTPAARSPALPDFSRWGEIAIEPLTSVRRRTAENMANAWTTVPHVTQFDRADITQLESMRKSFNRRPEASGRKLTVTAVAIKLAASALRRFPKFNASLDVAAQTVIFKRYVHVGVAVDTARGLLVPVIRDVDHKGLLQIVDELDDLAERARDKKLRPDEMQGATFTVSNLGGLGTTYFSPIVNWPEVAVLGVGRAETQAVAEGGTFKPALILPLSLSYDHRLIDGADAARFLRWVAEALEQPLLLLLEDLDGSG